MSDDTFSRVRLTWKEAAGGLYGYPKQTQKDCEVAIRKVAKRTAALAQTMFSKDWFLEKAIAHVGDFGLDAARVEREQAQIEEG